MMKRFFVFAPVLFCSVATSLSATESTPLSLNYIRHIGDGAYSLYGSGIPSDASLVNIYANGVKIDASHVYMNKGGIDVRNFYPITGGFSLERMRVEYGSGDIANYISDQKSDVIKVLNTSTIGFNGQVFRQSRAGYDVISLPFISKIPSITSFSQNEILSDRKIVINGQEQPLVTYVDGYKDGIYYITPDGITFIEKNLTERLSLIGLKIDGLTSNYVSVKKAWIDLDSPSHIEIEEAWATKNLKLFFSIPKNFTSLEGKEIWINGVKLDNVQASIGLGQFIIRYDLLKLSKDQDTLAIILKDTSTNQFSDEKIVDVSGFSKLTIDSIDTGKWNGANFTFAIKGNINALIGDVYKIKININGTDYTRDGTKVSLKDASGSVQKDSNGDDRYETKNKIEFRKTGGGLEFDFYYSQLLDGENIVYIKNENTSRESNKVSFFRKNNVWINYNYLTGASIGGNDKNETLSFEPGKDTEESLNPISMTPGDLRVSLGKIGLSGLKDNEYYSLAFALDTNLQTNPFSSLALGTLGLEAVKNGNTFSFVFYKQGFWKNFKTDNELLGTINEVLNTQDKPFLLKISEITLSKLAKDNTYVPVSSLKSPLSASMSYVYTDSVCFDGTKDMCSRGKESDPVFSLRFSASGSALSTSTSSKDQSSDTGVTIKTTKKNITSILLQDFWNSKFQKIQDVLVKKHEELRKKGSRYLPAFRKASNDILRALKNFELKIDTIESIQQVKDSLVILNSILRQSKKE